MKHRLMFMIVPLVSCATNIDAIFKAPIVVFSAAKKTLGQSRSQMNSSTSSSSTETSSELMQERMRLVQMLQYCRDNHARVQNLYFNKDKRLVLEKQDSRCQSIEKLVACIDDKLNK